MNDEDTLDERPRDASMEDEDDDVSCADPTPAEKPVNDGGGAADSGDSYTDP